MTERKPPGVSFETWVEKQIREAKEKGAFENLPGAGKPIAGLGGPQEEQSWVKSFIRREQIDVEPLLPTSVLLRKEIERLPEKVGRLRTEEEVRETVAELNQRILDWWRHATGPQMPLHRVNADRIVREWQAARDAGEHDVEDEPPADDPAPERPTWWRRVFRRR